MFDNGLKPAFYPKRLNTKKGNFQKYITFWYKIKRRLKSVIEHFYPQVNARIIFQSSNSIQNFFKFKDRIPLSLASSVVYQYTCRQCSATYIGETKKQLKVRISQHKGISFRTYRPLSSFDSSKIYEHAFDSNHPNNLVFYYQFIHKHFVHKRINL